MRYLLTYKRGIVECHIYKEDDDEGAIETALKMMDEEGLDVNVWKLVAELKPED